MFWIENPKHDVVGLTSSTT
jgi:hypothetical protein